MGSKCSPAAQFTVCSESSHRLLFMLLSRSLIHKKVNIIMFLSFYDIWSQATPFVSFLVNIKNLSSPTSPIEWLCILLWTVWNLWSYSSSNANLYNNNNVNLLCYVCGVRFPLVLVKFLAHSVLLCTQGIIVFFFIFYKP